MNRALTPLVPLYAAATAMRNRAFAQGWLRQQHLRAPVVSIGNLSIGGAGKTPLTIRIAELLRDRGVVVDVLSRGYGRRSTGVRRVEEAGSWQEFGDEPLLIARHARVPVYVGASRYEAGLLAESESSATELHLLDDGFQHRELARNVDIVVLHRSDFGQRLLPAGRLREPFSALQRAHIFVLREEDRDREAELRSGGYHQPIWWMKRHIDIPEVECAIAFCAIAHPEEFLASMEGRMKASRVWRDHHVWRDRNITELVDLLRSHRAMNFATTEKDLVRLSPKHREKLQAAAPIHIVRLQVRLRDEGSVVDQMLARLHA